MAKVSFRTALFVCADGARAGAAVAAFDAAAARLGMPWRGAATPPPALAGVEVVVPLDGAAPDGWTGRVEKWNGALAPDAAAAGLIARLLGGTDQEPKPKPAPPPPPKKVHTVKLSRETAGRKGKGVTVVSELPLTEDALKELATKLKNACGTGGTAKDGRIEIQGDHRDKLQQELEKLGYKVKRAGG
ncbi:translation initiation factor Sui1 [Gemmata obscuriglobus]|nr:translation initiation factor SUI1 [Gemmata obscuriglobus]QEG26250.1 translation initiation factor Sui1 [Gemmata obscuriglobus]VTS01039.1 translation initiation factor sui1 : Translation initiation factor 1 (EIF-1/SUI1) OS=Halomonas sp. HAL1 GN=HAL1_19004 PE=4 SV=1: SUI1 [Gemmata obscuriglobus UQM 2246]